MALFVPVLKQILSSWIEFLKACLATSGAGDCSRYLLSVDAGWF